MREERGVMNSNLREAVVKNRRFSPNLIEEE